MQMTTKRKDKGPIAIFIAQDPDDRHWIFGDSSHDADQAHSLLHQRQHHIG